MSSRVICVNSTLAGQSTLITAGEVAPLHTWGFSPSAGDHVLSHHLNRYEVVLRARLNGLDPAVLARVLWRLVRGYRRIYLVTAPDVRGAVPMLKKLFPRLRVVMWVWTAQDVAQQRRVLEHCDHIFCLTEGAVAALHAAGLGQRASLQYWGVNPSYYAQQNDADEAAPDYDVALFGQTLRDMRLAARAATEGDFRVVATANAMRALTSVDAPASLRSRLVVESPRSHREMLDLFRRARVSWIPLLAADTNPTGYTNLAESLLIGTPVVIADSSILPRKVLELPGVYRYRVGDVTDFMSRTREALAAGASDPGQRSTIRRAAADLLDGRQLRAHIDDLLRSHRRN